MIYKRESSHSRQRVQGSLCSVQSDPRTSLALCFFICHIFKSIISIMEELLKIMHLIVLQNQPEILVRAHAIMSGIQMPKPKTIKVNLYREDFPNSQYPEGITSSTTQDCNVIGTNFYRMADPYLVELPNGNAKWVADRNNR